MPLIKYIRNTAVEDLFIIEGDENNFCPAWRIGRQSVRTGSGTFGFSFVNRRQGTSQEICRRHKKLIGDQKPLVFSSDLVRSWETAMIICEELKLDPPIPDRRLRERDMGKLQNLHWTKIDWETINGKNPPVGILESRQDFLVRIKSFLTSVLDQKKTIGETMIAVTHGGTLTFIYHMLLGTDLDKVPYIRNAAAHVFNLKHFPIKPDNRGTINEFVKQKKRGGKVK